MFDLQLIDLPPVIKVENNFERYYATPEGKRYPSVTSVLKEAFPKPDIVAWKERVGEREAARVSGVATNRGKVIHKLVEDYIHGNVIDNKKIMPINLQTFLQMKRKLDAHLTIVYGVEAIMISERLGIAGTADLIGIWDNKPSIIDHKTAAWLKRIEDIQDYFYQCALYAMMFEDLTGIKLEQIVVLIGNDDSPEAQDFVGNTNDYIPGALDILRERL